MAANEIEEILKGKKKTEKQKPMKKDIKVKGIDGEM